jgi:hypothetical protein
MCGAHLTKVVRRPAYAHLNHYNTRQRLAPLWRRYRLLARDKIPARYLPEQLQTPSEAVGVALRQRIAACNMAG